MIALTRLPGCTCKHLRFFTSTAAVSNAASQASTSKLASEPRNDNKYDDYNAFAFQDGKPSESSTGSLAGLRVSIKDNFVTSDGIPTTCGSRMLSGYRSPFEATVVKQLRENGATIVGKTNMDEFGMGSHGVFSTHGSVKNPLNPSRVAGGSSSGAAVSVAADYCDVAIGSDTGGSVRLPASYTGTLGFKPSYGLLSRYGLVAYASSLDTVGIISKRAHDAARVFNSLNQYDANDPTSIMPEHRRANCEPPSPKRLKVGIPVQCFPTELSDAAVKPLRQALAILRRQVDVELVSVSIPSITKTLSAYYTIASAEASSNLARYSGTYFGVRDGDDVQQARTNGFGEEVRKRIILGTYALTADAFDNYFLAAQTLRQQLKSEMNAAFATPNALQGGHEKLQDNRGGSIDGVDILVYPSAISAAPYFEQINKASNGVDTYVQDVLTVPASLAGLPAASCPVWSDQAADGQMPIGVQIVGQWGDDNLVLQVAQLLEES